MIEDGAERLRDIPGVILPKSSIPGHNLCVQSMIFILIHRVIMIQFPPAIDSRHRGLPPDLVEVIGVAVSFEDGNSAALQ